MTSDREPTGSDRADTPTESTAAGEAEDTPGEATDPGAGSGADGASAGVTASGDGPDRWEAFGPASVRAPGRVRRWAGRLGRVLSHEWTVVSVLGVLLSVAMTWPAALHPSDTLPEDLGDPPLVAWILSWSGHALTHDPSQLWHTNAFYPNPYSLAFTDTMLGYLPAGLIGTGWVAAVIRYNVLFIFAFALAFVGAYALVRQLGANRVGAALAGVAYAYAPWHYSQSGHLHIMSNGGIVLALAMLARGHGLSLRDGYRRELVRPRWILAGWLVAAWQISIGFGIGIIFGYVLGGCVLVGAVAWLLRRWRIPRRAVLFNLIGGVVFLAVTAFMAYPFFRVMATYPNVGRTISDLRVFSPPLRGFLVAPPDSLVWGTAHTAIRESLPFPPEMALLPGFALIGLALAGLFVSAWSLRARLALAAAVVVTLVCALGTNGPFNGWLGYVALYHLPGIDALRTPGRLIIWTTLLLGVLAAGALTGLAGRGGTARGDRVPGWRERLLRVASLIPLALVVAEGVNTMPHPVVPAPPAGFSQLRGPFLVLPDEGNDDEVYMLWSTSGFPTMVNGLSGYQPPKQAELRAAGDKFPEADSVEQLRAAGVRTVVILRDKLDDPMRLAANVDSLGITREERGDMIIYTLTP
ncbi:hypothetical protein [Planosporangium mesophilum]|uniref:Glycosyltransferase RgtA/B/C/D-like domain-containing protein n=1 Tax=Planosporangium mesophilum TaxID=689768 RepID=A0A8J3T9Q2_9ACTN|nr:hypothetical protein [Planosporangium mesophilum]NJC82249.1 hypothetical protein [Planosporangium mesophilum]GII22299.1 hypothetical protein Pme01_18960 [Planosporangium mesophilum]